MQGLPIRMVNNALQGLGRAFSVSENAENICAGIITFGGTVQLAQPYTPVSHLDIGILDADDGTPFGAAVNNSLDAIEAMVTYFRVNGITTIRRPVLAILSDGNPTDDWKSAAARLQKKLGGREGKRMISVVVGAVTGANRSILRNFVSNDDEIIDLTPESISKFIHLTSSLSEQISQSGGQVVRAALSRSDNPDQWGELEDHVSKGEGLNFWDN
jgi:uncharacterized protein YegL